MVPLSKFNSRHRVRLSPQRRNLQFYKHLVAIRQRADLAEHLRPMPAVGEDRPDAMNRDGSAGAVKLDISNQPAIRIGKRMGDRARLPGDLLQFKEEGVGILPARGSFHGCRQ